MEQGYKWKKKKEPIKVIEENISRFFFNFIVWKGFNLYLEFTDNK